MPEARSKRPAGNVPPNFYPMGGPPAGLFPAGTPGGPLPPWVDAIRPNYAEVRRRYVLICFIAAAIIFLLENVMFLVYSIDPDAYGGFQSSIPVYLLHYNIIPSVINFLAAGAAWYIHKHGFRHEIATNCAPVCAMVVICTVAASAHTIYSVTMSLLCLPIFMITVYGLRKLNLITTAACALGILVAAFCRSRSPYLTNDMSLVPEMAMAFIILLVTSAISFVILALLDLQKSRLLQAARDAQIASQEAQAASREAQAANQAKSEFLASMSHEIRTPLNAVLGMTEMISRRTDQPEIQEYAGDIQQAGSLLLAIINDILDISKIESGRMEIRESRYELGSLINDSYNMVAVRCREKSLTMDVICDPMLPRLLYGDEFHMRQILVNLLSNAVKYTQRGGVELFVSGEQGGDILRLEVRVKDTGVGIREEDIPHLFDKFSRLDLVKNRQVEGTGLGLPITKRLVELMNGTITVESVYGVGSTFIVRVPQKVADSTPIGDIYATYLDFHGTVEGYQQTFEAPEACILVVDDVSINLQVIRRLLEATQVQIDTAQSGPECLRKVRERRYDLILMDHMMPGMDGVAAMKAMGELPDSLNTGVPVIMLTANAMVGAREEYLEQGFVDYLSKPVRGARLEAMLLKYLPEDKLHRTGVVPEPPKALSALDRLRLHIPELDVASGLGYCAEDESFYRTMLAEFASGGRADRLTQALEAADWSTYQVEAHSLKSAAKMVGLPQLSEECRLLEEAAKQGDEAAIRAGHPQAAQHYRTVSAALLDVLDAQDASAASSQR